MKDQRTRQNTTRRLKDSSAQSSHKLPQLKRPPNDSHFFHQGTTHESEKQLPEVDHQLTHENRERIQALPRASSDLQQYQQSVTMDRSLPNLVQPHLTTLTPDKPMTHTVSNTSPTKLETFADKTVDQAHSSRSDHETSMGDNHARNENHQVSEHRSYICAYPNCGKSFKQRGNLKTHERKHTGDKPYQCLFKGCGKAFAQMGNLQTHEKIHWPVKPYVCDYPSCNRGFTQRSNLKAHLTKIHHVTPY